MHDLRGTYILSLNKPKTTSYDLNSFSYILTKYIAKCATWFSRTTEFTGFKLIQDRILYSGFSFWLIYL